MQLGGWKTEKMMRRYAAVTDTTLRRRRWLVVVLERLQSKHGYGRRLLRQRVIPIAIAVVPDSKSVVGSGTGPRS